MSPLVVFRDTQHCDTRYEHPVTLITDGLTAYCHGPSRDAEGVERVGEQVSLYCPEEWCHGHVTFNLDAEGTWTGDPAAVSLLVRSTATTMVTR
jgi:hypothetical protein